MVEGVKESDVRASGPRARFRLRATGWIGGICLLAMTLLCLGSAPWMFAADPDAPTPTPRYDAGDTRLGLLSPSWIEPREEERSRSDARPAYLLGTDTLGRSLLRRTLTGGAISLGIGIAAAVMSVTIGTLYGAIAGWFGGAVDAVMMRIVDVVYGLPYVLLVVLLAVASEALIDHAVASGGREISRGARLSLDVLTLLIAIGGVSWLTMARVVRGQVMSLKSRPFVDAARSLGAGPVWIFTRHLLPNLTGVIIVYATLTAPQAILQESFLSFLGIGVKPPLPSWGNLAADGLAEVNTVRSRWWLLAAPCALLGLTLLSLNFVGEGLRELLDPKGGERT